MKLQPKTMHSEPAPSRPRPQRFAEQSVLGLALSVLALLPVPAILGGTNLPAQTHTAQATKPMQQQEADARPAQPRRLAATHARAASVQRPPAPEAIAARPAAAPAPAWPANQPLNEATVTWDSRGLKIEAWNSSLVRILHQVLADTGARLQGLAQDQRVFGTYGPGPAGDVLSKLLDDSGYNVLMIGGRDPHAPPDIVLSVSPRAIPQTDANNRNRSNSEEDEANPPPEQPPPPPMETPFGNGDSGKPETPQQIMRDILDRQQKIDQQQATGGPSD